MVQAWARTWLTEDSATPAMDTATGWDLSPSTSLTYQRQLLALVRIIADLDLFDGGEFVLTLAISLLCFIEADGVGRCHLIFTLTLDTQDFHLILELTHKMELSVDGILDYYHVIFWIVIVVHLDLFQ